MVTNIKLNRFPLPLIILFFLVACEKSTKYEVVINNSSQYDLWFKGFRKNASNEALTPIDSFKVNSNSQYVAGKLVTDHDISSCNPNLYDSIHSDVINHSDRILFKNLRNNDIFFYSKTGSKSKGYTVQCTATITDADIVPK